MNAGDGEDTRKLHNPPDEHFHAQQRVAYPRTDDRSHENKQRDVGVQHVGARYVVVVSPDDAPLPESANEQNGREDEVHQVVGNEDDAERDDDEVDDNEREVDAESAFYLAGVEPDEQRDEDYAQQPCVLHQQLRGHDDEVLLPCRPYGCQYNGKGYDCGSHDDVDFLARERLLQREAVVALQVAGIEEVQPFAPYEVRQKEAED